MSVKKRFVGLSTLSVGLKDYIAQGHAPFQVYAVQSPEQTAKLGLTGTPDTILVGPGAKVERVWMERTWVTIKSRLNNSSRPSSLACRKLLPLRTDGGAPGNSSTPSWTGSSRGNYTKCAFAAIYCCLRG